MTLKKLFILIYSTMTILLFIMGIFYYKMLVLQNNLNLAQEMRYNSQLKADELRQSSDDLTRMARTFAVTGDPLYEKMYFEILSIRNGEKPRPEKYERIYWDFIAGNIDPERKTEVAISLQKMMEELGFSEEEFQKLKQAQANSDKLVKTETIAMNAVKGLYDDGKGNFTIKGAANKELAIRLMHDKDYHTEKAKIMKPIDGFFELLDTRTKGLVESAKDHFLLYFVLSFVLVIIMIGLIISSYFIINNRVNQPLENLVRITQDIAAGKIKKDGFEVKTKDEIGVLLTSYNKMAENIGKMISDIDTLAIATIDGKLSTRADATKHDGDYRKIIEGFNQTLDAVIEPIKEAANVLVDMSNCNLQVSVKGNYKGDHATISNALNQTILSLREKISDISRALNSIAEGNLSIKVEANYNGDFIEIKNSLLTIKKSLVRIVSEISDTTNELSASATELDKVSQTLSQGATEQAASFEESSASIEELLASVSQTAENAQATNRIAFQTAAQSEEGGRAVKETAAAMKQITEKISIVEEIASQTNLLSVNATIEAARAGEMGLGFSVVAGEVRKLAAGSKSATKTIKELTASSLEIALVAGNLLHEIVPNAKKTSDLVAEITAAADEQNHNLQAFNKAIEQLNELAQTGAATAEELAASAENLNAQANKLKATVKFFKIEAQSQVN